MRTIRILQKLINVFFYLLVFSAVIYTLGLVLYFMPPFQFLPEGLVTTHTDVSNDIVLYLFRVMFTLAFVLFIKGIFHLRKAIPRLIEGDYFSNEVELQFKRCGNMFVIVGLLSLIVHFESQVYLNSMIWLGIDNQIYIYIFLIVIGLFFKLFGLVITQARYTKEENELTI